MEHFIDIEEMWELCANSSPSDIAATLASSDFEEATLHEVIVKLLPSGQIETLSSLLGACQLLSRRDSLGLTLAHRAVLSNRVDVIREFCSRKECLHSIDSSGRTPLDLARSLGMKAATEAITHQRDDKTQQR